MARARKKSKYLSQRLVGVAASGLPSPIQKLLGRPIISFIVVLGLLFSLATGLVFVKWENGIPTLSINEEKAAEAEKRALAQIEEFRAHHHQHPFGVGDAIESLHEYEKSWSGLIPEGRHPQEPQGTLAERVFGQPSQPPGGYPNPSNWYSSPANQYNPPPAPPTVPMSQMPQPYDSRR